MSIIWLIINNNKLNLTKHYSWFWTTSVNLSLNSNSVCSNPPRLCLGGFEQTSVNFSLWLTSQITHEILYRVSHSGWPMGQQVHLIILYQIRLAIIQNYYSVFLCVFCKTSNYKFGHIREVHCPSHQIHWEPCQLEAIYYKSSRRDIFSIWSIF